MYIPRKKYRQKKFDRDGNMCIRGGKIVALTRKIKVGEGIFCGEKWSSKTFMRGVVIRWHDGVHEFFVQEWTDFGIPPKCERTKGMKVEDVLEAAETNPYWKPHEFLTPDSDF